MRNTKRVISMILVVCMLLCVLPLSAFAVSISPKPENGTTVGQPFAAGTGGSTNFRIPGIVTLDNGTLIAACDARWNHAGDGAGLDTIVSVSTDNGANWTYTFANYLGDNGNVYNNLSTCIIDPGIGTDGETAYLIADLWPAGIALNTSRYSPVAGENGFDDNGNLLLRALEDDTVAIGANGYNTMAAVVSRYQYYLDLETLELYAMGADGEEDTKIEGYTVDAYFNITGNGVNTNLFFADSPYQPYPTDYLYMTTSTDGLEWSEPTLLNLKEEAEQTLLVGPGNGTYNEVTGHMIFTAYEHSSGYERASLIWMDEEGNWTRSEDATVNTWSSEATAVVLDDGTVRVFYRDGYTALRYTDYQWSESANNYVRVATEVSTAATVDYGCQLTAIKYSGQIDGKDVILVAGPTTYRRVNGYIYTFLVDEDNSMELAYAYNVTPNTYAYSCLTEMEDGRVALLWESAGSAITFSTYDFEDLTDRDLDTRLDFVDVSVLTGETYTHTDNSGYYANPDLSELDTSVATVTVTGSETTTNAAKVLSTGANVDLDDCRYTFTANDDGTYVISNTVGDTTVYLNHYLTGNNNAPNITTAGNIAVTAGSVAGMFKLQAQVQAEGGSGVARTLHFHAEASTPYWNRCGSDTSYKCQEYLFRKAEAGETASTDIPGYVQLTSADEIADGGQYLIAAKNDAGNWYVLNPAATTTALDHVAQIVGSTTVGYTEVTITGVGAGYTEVQIGSTVYRITVKNLATQAVTIPVGSSVTYTQEGNYANADTSALDTSVATVTLEGSDGANDQGVALTPATTLADGTYVIRNTRANKLVNNTSASAGAAAGTMAGFALDGNITNVDADTAVWTIKAVDGGYTVQDTNGKYMTIGSNAGGLSDEAQVLTIAYANGTWTLMQNNAYLNDAGGAGTTASGWQHSSAAGDAGSQFDLYAYGESVPAAGTTVTFTGVYPGTTSLLVDRVRYEITVTGTVIDVELKTEASATYMIDTDALDVKPDASVATAEIVSYPAAQLGTDASYNGEFVDLADCLYTFTKNDDGTYVITANDAAVHLYPGHTTSAGYPNADACPVGLEISAGYEEGSFYIYSSTTDRNNGDGAYLFFDRTNLRWDRVSAFNNRVDWMTNCSMYLYRATEDGYEQVTALEDITGGEYLIGAPGSDGNRYVLYPTTSTATRYSQIGKMGNANAVTFTGVAEGETTARAGSTIFEITVVPGEHVCRYEAVVTAPTCTEGGYTTYTCSCGDSYVADETPALGHSFENGVCTVCGAGIAVNEATGETYASLAEALAAASAGDTVKLLADTAAEKVLVTPNVTLDLNGNELTADYVVGFNTAHVVDNVGTGKLVVAEKNVVLDESNGMVPVYDGTGYIFTKAAFAIRKDETHTDDGIKVVALAAPVNAAAAQLLADGAADNNLQVAIVLTWDNEQGSGSQKFVFTEEVVAAVYGSGTANGYAKMFSMVITGVNGISNLKANIVLISGTNAEYGNPNPVAVN